MCEYRTLVSTFVSHWIYKTCVIGNKDVRGNIFSRDDVKKTALIISSILYENENNIRTLQSIIDDKIRTSSTLPQLITSFYVHSVLSRNICFGYGRAGGVFEH